MLMVIIAIAAGLLLELFFQLIKYRDDLNKISPQPIYNGYDLRYMPLYQPFGYMSVTDFLSGGKRRWGVYFLFRLFPPFAIFMLLAGILERYYAIDNVLLYILIAATISLLPRDLLMIFKAKYISERLIHAFNTVAVYTIAIGVSLISIYMSVAFVAPSLDGLFDNLWSTLTVAAIVLIYSRVSNPQYKQFDQQAEKTARDNYVFESYKTIKARYASTIEYAISEYGCSRPILYAVLIYENMNRPSWMRKIENIIVKTTRQELTVGIAQVKSDKALSDSESIMKAARILQGSSFADSGYGSGFVDIQQLESILEKYNSSALYAESISEIMAVLRQYTTDVFRFDYTPRG